MAGGTVPLPPPASPTMRIFGAGYALPAPPFTNAAVALVPKQVERILRKMSSKAPSGKRRSLRGSGFSCWPQTAGFGRSRNSVTTSAFCEIAIEPDGLREV